MNSLQIKLCDIQGRLFELSYNAKYDSAAFIKAFMTSELAKNLDATYNKMQWVGEEYLFEELMDQSPKALKKGVCFSNDTLYWTGYVYRYWHILTGETSKKIYSQAPAKIMNSNYRMLHTMDPELAIEDLKEMYRQTQKSADCPDMNI